MQNFQFEIDPIHYIIAIGAMFVTVYKVFVKPRVKRWQELLDNIDRIGDVYNSVQLIRKEVFPNSGGSFRDAVDRIETRIILLEQKHNIVLRDARHGLFETDVYGRWVDVNRTLCRMIGATEKELLGFGWKNFTDPVTAEKFHQAITNEIEFRASSIIRDTDGNNISVTVIASPLRSSLNKKLIGYLGTIDETIKLND